MSLSMGMFKVSTASSKLKKSSTALRIGSCDRLFLVTRSAFLFKACGTPPTLHLKRHSPLGLYSVNLKVPGPLKSGQLAGSQFCVLRAVYADAPSCWKTNPVGSQRLL